MVTLYKTMIDHNSIPNVEPQAVAYKEDLEELVKYVPQRRNNYEKRVGRSVKMGEKISHVICLITQSPLEHMTCKFSCDMSSTYLYKCSILLQER